MARLPREGLLYAKLVDSGLLSPDYEEAMLTLRQDELNNELAREYGLLDYFASPDPYGVALKGADIPQRYSPDSFSGEAVSALNSAKNHIADMFTGQASLDREEQALQDNRYYESLSPEEAEDYTRGKIEEHMMDWVGVGPISKVTKKLATSKPKKIRHREKDGHYVGAPARVDTPQKLGATRKDYMKAVKAGPEGADWYYDSSDFIKNVTPNDTRASQTADLLGITSSRTPVDTNLGQTIKGNNQFAYGMPVNAGGFPNTMSPLMQRTLQGEKFPLGYKREPFAENLKVSWLPTKGARPVHDIWDGRAWGYTDKDGKPWDGGFSETQHAWMDGQASIIDERLNAEKFAGRTDWNPLRTQASAWTGGKKMAGNIKRDVKAKHFGDYQDKYTAYGTNEQVTGKGTGHLEGLADLPEDVRKAFSEDPRSSWLNSRGQDSLYADAGVLVAPSEKGHGVFTSEMGGTEFNPLMVAKPLVSRDIITKTRANLADFDVGILDSTEALRAFIDTQNAGAWHKPFTTNPAGDMNSIQINGLKANTNTIKKLNELAENNGMFIADEGSNVAMINDDFTDIGGARTGKTLGRELKGPLGKQIEEITGIKPIRSETQTGYLDFEKQWKRGHGHATKKLLDTLDKHPEFIKKLDTPVMRQKAMDNLMRDIEYSKKYGLPIREDIQRGLKALHEGGIEGLREEWGKNTDLFAQVISIPDDAV